MAKKLWVKTGVGSVFSEITNFYVKTSTSGWSQITDAWVKTGVGATWSKFWEALMSPSQAVELIESYTGTNSDTLRFQGRNYKWTPAPQSLKYYFRWIPDGGSTYYVGASGSSGDTASNPTTSNLWPSSTTYITISPSGSNFELGKTNRYYFEVRATGASGTVYSSQSTEDVKIVSPKAPTITYTVASSTSVNLTITPASYEDWFATGRYIVYTYDITGGTITSGGGRGAVTAGSNPSTVTLTGLTPGRNYTVYALPVTGTSGTTPSNYSGYPGIEGYLSGVTTGSADPQAFTTISYVKNFPSSSSGGVVRTTTLSWNASTNATRYEIEYEGSYNNSTWTTVQSFAASPYTSSTSQSVSWGSPRPSGGFDYYTYMRARVRASSPDSSVNVIGDGGSYIYAAGVAPGQPTFGTITHNTAGTTASIPVTVGTAGSNYLYSAPIEYQYRESPFGSYSGTWTSSATPISLTGLSPSTTYYIKIRTRNYDELVSPENETSFATPSGGVAPSGGAVTLTPSGTQMAGTTISANVTAMSGTATISYATTIRKKTGSAPTSKTDGTEVASGTGTGNGVATHTITTSEASGTPDQFRAFTTGTNTSGSNTVASNTVVSTPFVATQYTISWNGNGGTVSPTSNTVDSGTTVSAPTPTRSGYTFLYWRDSPSAFSYIYQINPGGSWTVTSNITFYAYWQVASVAPTTPTGVSVSGSGVVSWSAVSGADYYEVLNYTDRTGSPSNTTNRLGPYNTIAFGTSLQLGSSEGYSSPNNWARAQVRAWNYAGQVSTYSAWYPSSTTYV